MDIRCCKSQTTALVWLVVLILIARPVAAAAAQVNGEHCSVQYTGIDEAYAQALAKVCDTATDGFVQTYTLLPAKHVTIKVSTGAYETRLWTDGSSFIYLDLASADDLAPDSGYNHIYGICQELGHITMYSKLSTLSGLPEGVGEGWAHYTGSLVTDYVWAQLGADAWPQPFDYSGTGSPRLRGQCAQQSDDPVTTAACTFLAISDKYTAKKIGMIMKGALATKPAGNELMGRFARILDSRTEKNASAMIPDSVRKSPIVPAGDLIVVPSGNPVVSGAWTDDEGWLGYDDDQEDGMRSIAGSGHAVLFSTAEGGRLDKVMLKGARYGLPRSESKFRLTVLDGDFQTIKQWEFPFMEFMQRGEPLYWKEFDTGGLKVPAKFYVLFDFNPTGTDGVYVGFDANSSGHSYSALPQSHLKPFREGDWMIRALLNGGRPAAPRERSAPSAGGGWTGFDDDSEDGMRSIAMSGHSVKFHVDGGGQLTSVRLKGARYGLPNSSSRFTMAVLDRNFELLQRWSFPFMKFEQRGEPLYWVEFETMGVEVPADFYVLFQFNPTQTDGVYVGFDADSTGHSYTGTLDDVPRRFGEGDWMIEVKVD